MATKKIRVYELARELGVENHVVIELAEELKIGVKSHSSSIEDPMAEGVLEGRFRRGETITVDVQNVELVMTSAVRDEQPEALAETV